MRIVSFNANGIRSATEKGFFRWLARQDADVVCVQEIKAQDEQLAERAFRPRGWHVQFRAARHKSELGSPQVQAVNKAWQKARVVA